MLAFITPAKREWKGYILSMPWPCYRLGRKRETERETSDTDESNKMIMIEDERLKARERRNNQKRQKGGNTSGPPRVAW